MRAFALCFLVLSCLAPRVMAAQDVPLGPPSPAQATTQKYLVERDAKGHITHTYPNPEASHPWRSSERATTADAAPAKVGGVWQTINVIFRLLLVLLMAYGMVLLMKKYVFGGTTHRGGTASGLEGAVPLMRILESLSLGQGRALHVIRIGDHAYLVGVSQQQVTLLSDLAGNDAVDMVVASPANQGPIDSPFITTLNRLLSQPNNATPQTGLTSSAGQSPWQLLLARWQNRDSNQHRQGGHDQ